LSNHSETSLPTTTVFKLRTTLNLESSEAGSLHRDSSKAKRKKGIKIDSEWKTKRATKKQVNSSKQTF
jgi:hypothetical protein